MHGGDVESGFERQVFFGEVKGVEAVEQDGVVAGVGDKGFPGLVAGPWGFDEDDPGAPAAEVHAAQHGFFVAFDVDFQKVDGAVLGVLLADRSQGAGLDGLLAYLHARVAVLLGDAGFDGGQARVGDGVEGQAVGVFAGYALQVDVVWPFLAESVVVGLHRFDVDPSPAVIVERPGHGIICRMIGAYVQIKAVFHRLKGAPQAYVFEVLCVGNERHGQSLCVSALCQSRYERLLYCTGAMGAIAGVWEH